MAINLPYMNRYGAISKILEKIQTAQTPPKFTYEFLEQTLGFKGGENKTFISFAKKVGLLNSDGSPTEIYKMFRNKTESKKAMALALRKGYADLFESNENAQKLPKSDLEGLIVQRTGVEEGSSTARAIYGSFKAIADFSDPNYSSDKEEKRTIPDTPAVVVDAQESPSNSGGSSDFQIAYNIVLNLPPVADINVFNAIFKSLRENLLNKNN